MSKKTINITVGNKTLTFQTGQIARQANGSVTVQCGDTIILSTACAAPTAVEESDFFQLRIDYQEKYSSVGKTAGGFLKREGRPSEREILTSRLIDRPLRPMFEDGFYNETQVLSCVYSYDGIHAPDVLAICAASAALVLSDIPLIKPIGAVRVGYINHNFVINPTVEEMKTSTLDLVLAGTEDAILMIEGYCNFLTEETLIEAIEYGHHGVQEICHSLSKWQAEIGRPKKRDTLRTVSQEAINAVDDLCSEKLAIALRISAKQERNQMISDLHKEMLGTLLQTEEPKLKKTDLVDAFKNLQSRLMRRMILDENIRVDGRHLKEIRPIDIVLPIFPRTHGSALFTRGETQTISVCTLGGENNAQRYEDLHGEGLLRFYLQYFFPPFSVGEVGRIGAPGRREIGHGKLAERALSAVLPMSDKFPYVIRLESNITECNGSSSMASVCGGCLALMDAGVPIKRPVSGIAMGLILEGESFAILSDILGTEDALGDMDFKVAGDAQGITAFQMDIKVEGITTTVLQQALEQAKEGRIHILNKMLEVCPNSRSAMSVRAPRIETIQIPPSKIGIVIGPGGKQIRSIIETTGVEIDINDSGLVRIVATNANAMKQACEIVHNLTTEIEVGKTYTGRITGAMPFGFFVDILGKQGLCHISEIVFQRLHDIQDAPFKVGDQLVVKVLEINNRGQIKLSHKATLDAPEN